MAPSIRSGLDREAGSARLPGPAAAGGGPLRVVHESAHGGPHLPEGELARRVRTLERLSVPAVDDELCACPVGDLLGLVDGLPLGAEHGGDPLAALALDGPTLGMGHDVLVSRGHKILSSGDDLPLESIRQEPDLGYWRAQGSFPISRVPALR